jgi:hypothetical protein
VALRKWRADVIDDLGGKDAISTQQEALIDLACKSKLLLDSVDAWLMTQPSLVNKRKRSLFPVVLQRQTLADGLARYLGQLGLERRVKPPETVSDLLNKAQAGRREGGRMSEITFREFAELMAKRRRTVDDLVDLFRGKLEDSRSFFERVMSCQWRNPETGRYEDRGGVVIPYRSVIEFYRRELAYLKNTEEEQARQALKRKRPVSEERKQALRKQLEKARAARVRDRQNRLLRPAKSLKKLCESLPNGYLTLTFHGAC